MEPSQPKVHSTCFHTHAAQRSDANVHAHCTSGEEDEANGQHEDEANVQQQVQAPERNVLAVSDEEDEVPPQPKRQCMVAVPRKFPSQKRTTPTRT